MFGINFASNDVAILNHGTTPKPTDSPLTFKDLFLKIQAIAKNLTDIIPIQNENVVVVGVMMESCVELVVAYFGILYAGYVFCPLGEKQDFSEEKKEKLKHEYSIKVIIDQSWVVENCKYEQNKSTCKFKLENPVHLIFTSATTSSNPKAILCNGYGSLNSHLFRNEKIKYSENDVTGCNLFGIWDVVSSFMAGKPIVCLPDKAMQNLDVLESFISTFKITRIMLTPSLLKHCNNRPSTMQVFEKHLRVITLCGETFENSYSSNNKIQYVNLYSLSETHDVALSIDAFHEPMDVYPHSKVYILDGNDKLCKENTFGRVHVGGMCLGLGYFKNAKIEPFSRNWLNPKTLKMEQIFDTKDIGKIVDGKLIITGRDNGNASDFKINGFRISRQTCEDQLRSGSFGIQDAIVLIDEISKELVAGVVLAKGLPPNEFEKWQIDVRKDLFENENILNASIPTTFVQFYESFPCKLGSGKRDLRKILSIVEETKQKASPRKNNDNNYSGSTEDIVLNTMEQVTKKRFPSSEINFFHHGGNSLLLFELVNKLELIFQCKLKINLVLKDPTPRGLIHLINKKGHKSNESVDLKKQVLEATFPKVNLINDEKNNNQNYKAFVAGGSGFVGLHICYELFLDPSCSVIYVLLRKPKETFLKHLEEIGGSKEYKKKLKFIFGSIPELEITLKQIPKVDKVFNCIGEINMFKDYDSLKLVNVQSVVNFIQAIQLYHQNASFYHLSSSASLPPLKSKYCPDECWDDLEIQGLESSKGMYTADLYDGIFEGYAQTKWVSEQIVARAFLQCGLRGKIYRPSSIAPSLNCAEKMFQKQKHSMFLLYLIAYSIKTLDCFPIVVCNLSVILVEDLAKLIVHSDKEKRVIINAGETINIQDLAISHENLKRIPLEEWKQVLCKCENLNISTFAKIPFAIEGVLGLCEVPLKPKTDANQDVVATLKNIIRYLINKI